MFPFFTAYFGEENKNTHETPSFVEKNRRTQKLGLRADALSADLVLKAVERNWTQVATLGEFREGIYKQN